MKAGKAAGPDELRIQLIESLEEVGVEHLTKVLNTIYSPGHLPKDLCTSVVIALPKTPGATECGQHRTINLMSQITKLLLRIIMLRIRSKIKQEIREEQCGFAEGKAHQRHIYTQDTCGDSPRSTRRPVPVCYGLHQSF